MNSSVTQSAMHDKMYGLVTSRREQAQQIRNFFEDDWDRVIDFYMQNRRLAMPPGTEWMSDAVLPELFYGIESLLPRLCLDILRNPRSFSVEAPTIVGEKVQSRVEALLRQQRRAANFEYRVVPAIRVGALTGTVVMKNYWLQEMGEALVPLYGNPRMNENGEQIPGPFLGHEIQWKRAHNGPWTDFVDVYRYWKSPETDLRGNPLWVLEDIPLSLDYLEEQNRKYKHDSGQHLYSPETLRRYRTSASHRPSARHSGIVQGFNMRTPNTHESVAQRTSGITDAQAHGDALWCTQHWGNIPRQEAGYTTYADTQWRLQLWGPDGRRLRDEAMPTPNLRPPYREAYIMQVGSEPYGRSPARWALDEIQHMSELRTLRLAEAWINALGGYIASRKVNWEQGDFQKTPGFVWMYDTNGEDVRPDEVLMQVRKNPIMPEMYREVDEIADRVRKVLGTDANAEGQAYGRRTTGYEVSEINRKAGGKVEMQAALLTWQIEQKAMEDYFELNRVFLHEGEEVAVQGDDLDSAMIFAEDLDFNVDIYIDAGAFGSMDSVTLQGITQGLGMFLPDPETNMALNKTKMMEVYFRRLGIEDNLYRSPDEIKMEQIRQQRMALLAQAGAAAGQGGPGGPGGGVPAATGAAPPYLA